MALMLFTSNHNLTVAMDLEWSDSIPDVAMESPTKIMIAPGTTDGHRGQPTERQSIALVTQNLSLSSPLGQDASQMVRTLIRADAAKFFADNLEDMASFWTALVDSTRLPRNIFCPEAGVTSALRSLDKIFSAENSTPLALRLAFVQLPRVLDAASGIIATSKQQGRLKVPVGKSNSIMAMDLYSKAQSKESGCTRRELNLRRRLAQRWVDISATHPLLLVTYTEAAEDVM